MYTHVYTAHKNKTINTQRSHNQINVLHRAWADLGNWNGARYKRYKRYLLKCNYKAEMIQYT